MNTSHYRQSAIIAFFAVVGMSVSVPATSDASTAEVIVRAATTTDAVVADILAMGGQVTAEHTALGMVSATVSATDVAQLRHDADVAAVTFNETVTFNTTGYDSGAGTPLSAVADAIGATEFHDLGFTGAGIDVALIDSGVARVPAMRANLKDGVDLSFDAHDPARVLTDDFGHGTHLAGIIAGNGDGFTGIAPNAGLVNVKVGDRNGAVDVTQVIAGIDWVITNRDTDGRNIRVLALAFGIQSEHSYMDDPVAYAIDKAISKGIVAVVSAGNRGANSRQLDMPASHPGVLAVGASAMNDTVELADDSPTNFTSAGNSQRTVLGLAPGERILSLRAAGSFLDSQYPAAREGDQLFRGSGTSQSTAVMAGAVALLLESQPAWNPGDVNARLQNNVTRIARSLDSQVGAGALSIASLHDAPSASRAKPRKAGVRGKGSLDGARGGNFVTFTADDGTTTTLRGETSFTGEAWTGSSWNGSTWNGSTWNGSSWNGSTWNGSSWNGSTWNGSTWNGSSWNSIWAD